MEKKMIGEIDKIFDFDFEYCLKEKFKIIWEDFPCINPLRICRWKEADDGVVYEEN